MLIREGVAVVPRVERFVCAEGRDPIKRLAFLQMVALIVQGPGSPGAAMSLIVPLVTPLIFAGRIFRDAVDNQPPVTGPGEADAKHPVCPAPAVRLQSAPTHLLSLTA